MPDAIAPKTAVNQNASTATPENSDREKAIYYEALAIDDAQRREAYLNAVCAGDADLLKRVRSLLDADDNAGGFLGGSPLDSLLEGDPSTIDASHVAAGATIGRYKLLEKIGEGGFGVVYMAEQIEPVQRRVALKIIKAGMDTKQVIGRFEAERQALALMDHPNIAKVLDAGATEMGRPYFVMELVRGVPVTEYCDERNVSTEQRLRIFVEICAAVQHAHQKGIIHRDIKPSNILVYSNGDRPMPKVIDFGIAKATQGRLTDKTLFTQFRHFIGTPAYMSPEQAQLSGVDIDTRSDIYSLGVLLYELLTGKTPLDSKELLKGGYDEVCRRIREEEPPKPSTRLSSLTAEQRTTIAKHRQTDPERLRHLIRGELDWIVTKTMEKDRTRRYDTASALAQDIARHLRSEPVSAAPPSFWYKLRKFSRRNKASIATGGAIAAALIVGTVVATWLAVVANSQRAKADLASSQATDAKNEALAAKTQADDSARRAAAEELWARRIAYVTDMNLAQEALERNNMRLARYLLDRNRPQGDETDLRNWEWRALWRQCQGDAQSTFRDEDYVIWSASLSPNDQWLATSSLKGEIRIWDMQTERYVKTLSPEIFSGREPGRVAFSPGGDRLYATTEGGVIRVWTVPDWSPTELQFPHGDRVRSISLSEDGEKLAVFGFNATVSLWDVNEPNRLGSMPFGTKGGIQTGAVSISPDRKWLAVGLGNSNVAMYDAETLEWQFNFSPEKDSGEIVKTLAFSLDSQTLASGTGFADGDVHLWSVPDQSYIGPLKGHSDYLCSLAFSPNGDWLASASADQTIRLWNPNDWTIPPIVLRGHVHEVWAVCFSSDGNELVSGGKDGAICKWDLSVQPKSPWPQMVSGELDDGFQGFQSKRRASFSADALWLATRRDDKAISLRTVENLEVTHRLNELGTNHTSLLFAPHKRTLFVGRNYGAFTWFDPLHPANRKEHFLSTQSARNICMVDFTRDGSLLLIIAEVDRENEGAAWVEGNSQCILWSVENESEAGSWEVPANTTCAAISPDGSLVVTGHYDGTLRFWQVKDPRKPLERLLRDHLRGVTFSPNGELLATVNEYGRIELWDVASRESLGPLHGNMKAVFDVAFSPDGSRLVTCGSAGESVKVWDLATGQEVATLDARGYSFGQVEVLPDGNGILALNIAGDAFMWRVPSASEIARQESQSE